ncbi:alpha-tocopherol transfer protein [Drosophila grimshawi]|uniref:GH12309 n=1 Tax=Drosophila grimshawi TaxID=7222 RepID=B4JJ83_DROGR|nr:alpha-tocopherol transfer protein [Drosophila grimshawi]EDV99635.1 GH12309 [Drosophila grimshawi]
MTKNNNNKMMTATTTTTTTANAQDVEAKLRELQNWFENEPNLPEKIEPISLLRFLKCVEYDTDKTKALIQLNYSLRNKNPNIFIDRNMDHEMTAKGLRVSDLIILPGVTPDRHKLLLFRLADLDPRTRNSVEESKIFFMMADARFTEPDIERSPDELSAHGAENHSAHIFDDDIADGDVQIVDISGYTMRHLAYVSIFVLRVYMKFLHEAYPSRLRAIHVINCPSFLDRMMAMMKPFIREEVYQMINYHTEGMDSLYELIPRDMLPMEYGGKAGTVDEIKQRWLRILKEKTAYLSDEKYWKVTSESKSRWSWF